MPGFRSVWFRGAASAAILAYLIAGIDMRATGDALLGVDVGRLLVVLVLVGLDRLAMITRWVLLLRSSGQAVAAKSVAWIHLVSSFIGSTLPAGVGADAARAYTVARRTDEPSEAIASVAVDRLMGMIALAALGAVGLAVWSTEDAAMPTSWAPAAALFIGGLAVSSLWADRLVRRVIPTRWQRSTPGRHLMALADASARYRGRPAALGLVFGFSLAVQLLRILQAYLLGQGLGIDVEFTYYLMVMPIGLVALVLPVSVGGFGLPQGVIVWLLRPRGVPDPLSFALSTLIILTGLVGNLPGAVLYLRSKR